MIEQLMRGSGEWLAAQGPESDIVLTSRVRLARNLADQPFASRADEATAQATREHILAAARDTTQLAGALYFDLPHTPESEQQLLVERHLISHNLLTATAGGALVKPGEAASVMINEEDHLRITAFASGLQLARTLEAVNEIDDALDQRLTFAFRDDWGYLTACPTNVGTGLRASVLVHLPGLILSKRINTAIKGISHLGLTVRGYYGEGTDSIGDFFQISNQVTMGNSESDLIATITEVTQRIIKNELTARRQLYVRQRLKLENRVWRALGQLRSARLLPAEEAMELLSALRLGISMGIIPDIDVHLLNEVFLLIQPAHVQYYGGSEASGEQQAWLRARLVREKLAG
ncbi:MAG TPA: protein arginine kinase [bacterium]|nr:protein arginine kinase [bacterium]